MTDVNLSETAEPGVLLFFRLVSYEEFYMTSGVSFPFPADGEDRLLREYEQRTDHIDSQPESVQRFAAFVELYRDYGVHIQYCGRYPESGAHDVICEEHLQTQQWKVHV